MNSSKEIQYQKRLELSLALKGERSYVQGPDICHALADTIGEVSNVMIQFHDMSSHHLVAYWVTKSEIVRMRSEPSFSGLMVYQDQNKEKKFVVVTQDAERPIANRVSYDESKVIEGASIENQQITQLTPGCGNFFERVVALNKRLLNEVVELHPWIFSRIDLVSLPLNPQQLIVHLETAIGGRTYKSSILGDDGSLGSIYFSRRPD